MTNNILSISFGSFKMDVPLDGIKKLAKTAERKQKAAPAIVQHIETKEAMPTSAPATVAEVKTVKASKGAPIPYGGHKSFSAYLMHSIPQIPVGQALFVPHPHSIRARYAAHDAGYSLRDKGTHVIISVRQVVESGVSGIRIYRLR
jgi:hypothetical protein